MKRTSIYNLLVFVSFLAIISSCDNSKAEKEAAAIDSIKQYYTVVVDSLDSTWNFMIYEDDMKLSFMRQLLEEIKLTNEYDEEAVNTLMNRIADTQEMRYDQQSMGNQNLIDEYDFAISSLIKEITALARANPQFQNFPRMEQLIDNITYVDERVLFHRIHYDYFAKDYNRLVEDHSELVREVNPEDPQDKVNVFQIIE